MARTGHSPQPQAEGTLNLQRWLSLVQANAPLVCGIVLAVTLCGLVLSYALPKKYAATSTVSVEQNVISDLIKGIAITPSVESKLRILEVSLLSRDMLLGVADELDMDLKARTPAEQERLLESMRAKVDIRYNEKKGLFFISYTDSNPALARDFVNTITRRYIEESTASKRKESFEATSFLGDQIQMYQKRIDQAQLVIDAYKAEKGMYLGLNEQLLREQIKDQEQRLENLRVQKNERLAKLQLLEKRSPLRDELEKRELELQNLMAGYTEKHPAVIRTKESVKNLRASVEAEEADPGGNRVDKTDLEYQKLTVELQSLDQVEATTREDLQKNIHDLQELPAIRTELAALEQSKKRETLIYEQLVARFGQSEVSKQMELQDKSVVFRVIEAAVLPTQYIFPLRHLIILGSIFAGFALAVGGLAAHDLLRSKIRSSADLRGCDCEVLAKLPRLYPPESFRRRRRRRNILACTAIVLLLVCAVAVLEFLHLPYIESAIASIGRTVTGGMS